MDYLKELFETDGTGKPVAKYAIRTENDANGRSQIKNPDHSVLVLSHLQQMTKEMDRILDEIAEMKGGDESVHISMQRLDDLNLHGQKLLSQAFYLDTADRNDWKTVEMVNRKEILVNPAKVLSSLWHGQLEIYLDQKVSRPRHDYSNDGMSP